MITEEVKEYIDRSVLCWLATASDGQPSVSPKELFAYWGDEKIIIANIASPKSMKNIRSNNRVCVSFVDVFSQKGFQLYGSAAKLEASSESYDKKLDTLRKMPCGEFNILSVIEVSVDQVNPIIAPSYRHNKGKSEEQMIEEALRTYGVTRA